MSQAPPPDPLFWDALPRDARATLPHNACLLLAAIESMRRKVGRSTFEATDSDLANAANRSIWFVRRALHYLKGKWITCEVSHGRRVITVVFRLKGLDEPQDNAKREADCSAPAPRGVGAGAHRSRRQRLEEWALAPKLPIKEERERASEHPESVRERPESAANAATGRDVLAAQEGGGGGEPEPRPEAPPSPKPDLAAEAAKVRAAIAEMERQDPRSHMLGLWRASLRRLEAGDASMLADRDPPPRPPIPSPSPGPSPPRAPTSPRPRPGPGSALDEAIRLCREGPRSADAFARSLAGCIGESENERTIGLLRNSARLLRPDYLEGFIRQSFSPGVKHTGKWLADVLPRELESKRKSLRIQAAMQRPVAASRGGVP